MLPKRTEIFNVLQLITVVGFEDGSLRLSHIRFIA